MDAIKFLVDKCHASDSDKERIQLILETLSGCSYLKAVSILEHCKSLMGMLPTTRTAEEIPQ